MGKTSLQRKHMGVDSHSSLMMMLCDRARHSPDRPTYTFLKSGYLPEQTIALGELDVQARAIALYSSIPKALELLNVSFTA
ncbi:hypothetical protein AY600_04415 [Phormidium willei BDU 130791]|nr:hypothetical protein AY600_04415 [Phormidium willei BDU 130791]